MAARAVAGLRIARVTGTVGYHADHAAEVTSRP
jgi:hypothetical protein